MPSTACSTLPARQVQVFSEHMAGLDLYLNATMIDASKAAPQYS